MLYKFCIGLGATLLLSGCGFQPLLSGDSRQQQSFELHVKGADYSAYKFRREMEKNLAYTPKFDDESYKLNVVLTETRTAAAYRHDANITRWISTLSAAYIISKGKQIIGQSTASSVTSYPMTPAQEFVTRTAEVAASNRTAINLAEDVSRDILRLIKVREDKGA